MKTPRRALPRVVLLILGILIKDTIGSERLSRAGKPSKRCIDYFKHLCNIPKSATGTAAKTIRR